MRRFVGTLVALVAVTLLVLTGFARLARQPGALIVADRVHVDEFVRPETASVGNDLTRLYLPLHLRIGEWLARIGHVPAWDPSGFGGRPLVGNPQAGLWYPPVWLVWWTRCPSALGWLTVAHLVMGGLGVYVLVRMRAASRMAAVVAAGVFALSPYTLAHVAEGHMPHVWSACWFPWTFVAVSRARQGSLPALLAVPLLVTLAALAGHIQEAYYLVLVVGIWMTADVLMTWRVGQARRAGVQAIVCAVVLGVTVGLTAIEWAPDGAQATWQLRGPKPSLNEAGKYHVHPLNVLQLLSPQALGDPSDYIGFDNRWETLLSLGWVPLVLVVIALGDKARRGGTRPWWLLALGAVVFAAGRPLGLFPLLYSIVPGMNRFRVPARSLFLAVVAGAVLAGLGLDRLRRLDAESWARLERSYRRWVTGIILVLAVGAGLAWYVGMGTDLPTRTYDKLNRLLGPSAGVRVLIGCARVVREPMVWVTLLGVGGLLAWGRRAPSRVRWVATALGVLALGELTVQAVREVPVSPVSSFLADDPMTAAMKEAASVHPFRVRALDAFYTDLPAIVRGVEKTNINDLFQLHYAAELYEKLYPLFEPSPEPHTEAARFLDNHYRNVRLAVLDRMNVGFVVSNEEVPDLVSWPLAASGGWRGQDYKVYRHPAPLPRAYVVPRAAVTFDDGSLVMKFPMVPPREAVLMRQDPLAKVTGSRQPFTPASYDATDPDRVVVRVSTAAPGLLVVADTWAFGWTATVDGQPTLIGRGNRAQRVLALEKPGSHEVVMTYRPPRLLTGMGLALISVAAWLTLVGYAYHRTGHRHGSPTRKPGLEVISTSSVRLKRDIDSTNTPHLHDGVGNPRPRMECDAGSS